MSQIRLRHHDLRHLQAFPAIGEGKRQIGRDQAVVARGQHPRQPTADDRDPAFDFDVHVRATALHRVQTHGARLQYLDLPRHRRGIHVQQGTHVLERAQGRAFLRLDLDQRIGLIDRRLQERPGQTQNHHGQCDFDEPRPVVNEVIDEVRQGHDRGVVPAVQDFTHVRIGSGHNLLRQRTDQGGLAQQGEELVHEARDARYRGRIDDDHIAGLHGERLAQQERLRRAAI